MIRACELQPLSSDRIDCDWCKDEPATKLLAGAIDLEKTYHARLFVCDRCCGEVVGQAIEFAGRSDE